jgi:hypothetical protein
MAFQKKIYTLENNGVFAEYWKISEISGNWISKNITIKLSGFFSEDVRLQNKNSLMEKTYNVDSQMFELYFTPFQMQDTNIIKKCYEFLKMNSSEFTDALDV